MAYENVFRTTAIHFGAARNRITYSREVMARKIVAADDAFFDCLSQQAEWRLARVGASGDGLSQKVYRTFARKPGGGWPDVESASRELCVSSRTLQRRLEEEGTSFQEILDNARADVARMHLRNGHSSIAEISWLLGFSDQRGFRRAFRRWTGLSPAEYRRIHTAAVAWHGTAHSGTGVATSVRQNVYIAVVIGVAPLVSGLLLYSARLRRYGFALLALSMFAAFLFGAVWHYLIDSPDAVWNLAAGHWTDAFRDSAFALLVSEVCGSVVGVLGYYTDGGEDGVGGDVLRGGGE